MGHNVLFETLEPYLLSVRPVVVRPLSVPWSPSSSSVRPSRRVPSSRRPLSVCPCVPSSVPTSSSVLCPSIPSLVPLSAPERVRAPDVVFHLYMKIVFSQKRIPLIKSYWYIHIYIYIYVYIHLQICNRQIQTVSWYRGNGYAFSVVSI